MSEDDVFALPTAEQVAAFQKLPASGQTWTDRSTTAEMPAEDRARVLHNIDVEEGRYSELEAQDRRLRAAEEKEYEGAQGPAEDELHRRMKEEADFAAHPPVTTADKTKWTPHPLIDSNDFQAWGTVMLGMALIGGIASKGNWMGATSALTGAVQGYLDGNQQRMELEWQRYEKDYQKALEHDKAVQKQFDDILKSKSLSVNQMIREIQDLATREGHQATQAAARARDLTAIRQHIDSMASALGRVEVTHDTNATTLRAGIAGAGRMTQSGFDHLKPEGMWLLTNMARVEDFSLMRQLNSRYGGPVVAEIVNNLGAYMQANKINPLNMTEGGINRQVQLSVQRTVSVRISGVERLTKTIGKSEGDIINLVYKLHDADDSKTWNWVVNSVKDAYGVEGVTALRQWMSTIGRQYIEAVTMPGSNAQLHATQSEWAESHFDPNMNIAQIKGLFKAVNKEIMYTSQALRETLNDSIKSTLGTGTTMPAEAKIPELSPEDLKAAGLTSNTPLGGTDTYDPSNPFGGDPAAGAAPTAATPPAAVAPPTPPAAAASSSSSSSSRTLQDVGSKYIKR